MNPPKMREIRAVIDRANTWDEVSAAQTRTLAFLRNEATKEEAADFKALGPTLGGSDEERVKRWKTQLLAYVDGLLDAA